jgi:hypothetical protein
MTVMYRTTVLCRGLTDAEGKASVADILEEFISLGEHPHPVFESRCASVLESAQFAMT